MKDLKLKNDTDIEVEYILKQKEEELAKLGTKQDEQLNKLTEKVLVKQGESLLCMFSKLLSANSPWSEPVHLAAMMDVPT